MAAVEEVSATGRFARPAEPPEWTETTRLLCAAAYLEGTFAQEVIEEIIEEPFRAVRVPEGVDIVPVAKHCIAARRQKTNRDLWLLGIAVLTVGLVLLGKFGFLFLGAFAAWVVVVVDLWISTFTVATKRLRATEFRPQDAPDPGGAADALDELAARQRGNLVVYSGFNPFTSAGFDLDGWSFVVDLRKGALRLGQRFEPQPFTPDEIHDAVAGFVDRLGIDGLTVEDRVYVSGSDIRDDRQLLPDILRRPAAEVPAERVADVTANPTHRIRHYRCFRVLDWRGELVVSLFLRCSVSEGRMFVEVSRFMLPPLRAEFRRIDGINPEISARDVLSILRRASARTFPLWFRSPSAIARPLLRMRRQAKREREVKRDHFFDYGSPITALDRARSPYYSRYFQKLDKEMYIKLFDQAVLDGIVEFLESHDIDPGDLSKRAETIINNGIMVPGGTVQAHNLAVGQGSKILNRLRGGGEPAAEKQ
jgi:hypothetical protein